LNRQEGRVKKERAVKRFVVKGMKKLLLGGRDWSRNNKMDLREFMGM
jgi:hypothetical protein